MEMKNPNDPATPAQRDYLVKLMTSKQIDEANQKYIPVLKKEMDGGDKFTKGRASKWIDWFNKFEWLKDTQRFVPMKSTKPSAPAAQEGYYIVQGDVYCVTASRQDKTKRIAKKLVIGAGYGNPNARWEYVRGMVYQLKDDQLLSMDEACALGKQHGICIACGKQLTDPESVALGMGTVCRKKYTKKTTTAKEVTA